MRTRADVERLPALPLHTFDPEAQRFTTVHTEPIRLLQLDAEVQPPPEEVAPKNVPWWWVVVGAILVALIVWKASRKTEPDEDERIARAAAAAVADPARDPADTFVNYLAVRLGCPQASVIAAELAARIMAAGVSAELASRSAALVDELTAQRYAGGASTAEHRDRARALTAELEGVWS